MKLSIIVPVFNEEKTILKILNKLYNLKFKTFDKEIIVINDGSTDLTKDILNDNKNLFDKLITYSSNKGKGFAVKMGLQNSTGTHIVFQDADLEYNPDELLRFEEVFLKFDADGIIGSRFSYDKYTRSHNILNKIGNLILTNIFNILYNTTFTDIYSCYFAYRKNLLNLNKIKSNGFSQHAEILSQVMKKGNNFFEVPINYNGRNFSEGKKIKFYHFFPVVYRFFIGRF